MIENHTDINMLLSDIYILDYFDNDKWVFIDKFSIGEVKPEIPTYTYVEPPHEINFYFVANGLNGGKKGRYRIGINIFVEGIGKYKLCSEFEVI